MNAVITEHGFDIDEHIAGSLPEGFYYGYMTYQESADEGYQGWSSDLILVFVTESADSGNQRIAKMKLVRDEEVLSKVSQSEIERSIETESRYPFYRKEGTRLVQHGHEKFPSPVSEEWEKLKGIPLDETY